jgi:glycosyltransferase involved in cell wall biosynthesis
MPTYNSAETITAAVQSALDQDYPDIEVLVVDDASTDRTPVLLRERFGGRIQLFVNGTRRGQSRNSNLAIGRSRGAFVKFLHADDRLEPRCVSRMIEAFQAHPSAGMAFSRRRIELHHANAEERAWRARHARVDRGFRHLGAHNPRGALFAELLAVGLNENWIGEPACVMLRSECLERVGGFHRYVRQLSDLDLWLRVAALYDVAFVDEELAVYRYSSSDSDTAANRRRRVDWLDRLWMLEGLVAFPELTRRYPELRQMRRAERRRVRHIMLRAAIDAGRSAPSARAWWPYMAQRALGPFFLRRRLFGAIS